MRKVTHLILLSILLLSACAPAAAPIPTPIPPTDVPTSTATDVPTEVPTATVEPTQTPNQIAENLGGLNSEREYKVVGEYLVDQYNQVPKAVMENGMWRKLDYTKPAEAEIMYGQMVPVEGEYILKDEIKAVDKGKEIVPRYNRPLA